MKTVLVIPVGGTICTAADASGVRAITDGAETALCAAFLRSDSPFAGEVRFDTAPNLRVLSENMTADIWNRLLGTFRAYVSKTDYDGVIIAHGTDTLAFSAALFSMILAGYDRPVFFVSSNVPLDDPRANGHANFQYAAEAICRSIAPQVYVPYRNPSSGEMRLHLASRLMQCPAYSEDFESLGQAVPPLSVRRPFVDWRGDWTIDDRIKWIQPYVGQRYDDVALDGYKAVLHTAYHSGTVPTEGGRFAVTTLLDACDKSGVAVYLMPSKATGEIYESVLPLTRRKTPPHFVYGCTVEAAYAKLVLAYSLTDDRDTVAAWMAADCSGEYVLR